MADTTKLCSNCKRDINVASFLMHEAFCLKNVRPCEICKMPIDQKLKDQHFEEIHTKQMCECGLEFEKSLIENHKKNECLKRQINCKFCDIPLYFDKLEEHLNKCGTRTELCNECKRYIQIKDQEEHFTSNCKSPPVIEKIINNPFSSTAAAATTSGGRYVPKIDANSFYKNISVDQRKHKSQNTVKNDDEMVPCEFCNELFPFDTLIGHEAICELSPNYESIPRNFDYLNMKKYSNEEEEDEDNSAGIPLEFLNGDYSIKRNNEQRNYNVNNNPRSDDENTIPCEFCDELFPIDQIELHQNRCGGLASLSDRPEQPKLENMIIDSNDPEEIYKNKIPCEFCGELYDIEDLSFHQRHCTQSLDNLDGLSRIANRKPIISRNLDPRANFPRTQHTSNIMPNNRRSATVIIENEVQNKHRGDKKGDSSQEVKTSFLKDSTAKKTPENLNNQNKRNLTDTTKTLNRPDVQRMIKVKSPPTTKTITIPKKATSPKKPQTSQKPNINRKKD